MRSKRTQQSQSIPKSLLVLQLSRVIGERTKISEGKQEWLRSSQSESSISFLLPDMPSRRGRDVIVSPLPSQLTHQLTDTSSNQSLPILGIREYQLETTTKRKADRQNKSTQTVEQPNDNDRTKVTRVITSKRRKQEVKIRIDQHPAPVNQDPRYVDLGSWERARGRNVNFNMAGRVISI